MGSRMGQLEVAVLAYNVQVGDTGGGIEPVIIQNCDICNNQVPQDYAWGA